MAKKKQFIIDEGTSSDLIFPPGMGRGYDPDSVVPCMFAPPTEIPLIPESDWSALIRDRKKYKTGLRDLFKAGKIGKVKDQNGQGYSHTEDTEVLTEKGWVRWPDWNHTDLLGTVNPVTHRLEFQAATEWHASEYRGETYHSTNRRLDFGVTNYHRMYVRKWDQRRGTLSDEYSFQLAQDLGWFVGLMPAPSGWTGTELVEIEIPNGPRWDGDDFVAVLALLVSDGYASGTGNDVSFCCFDERYSEVAALAARTGFREQPGRKGVWHRRGAPLAEWVRKKCYTGPELGALRKCVPDVVKVASMRQIKHFLHWFGDRTRPDVATVQFYSSSKRLIDDLQVLHLQVGKRAHVGTRPACDIPFAGSVSGYIKSKESYVLTVAVEDRLCIDRKKHIEKDGYRGLVYCATVPNGLLVTRRNNSVLISGNCWAYSTTRTAEYVRAVMNLEYVALSAHSVGCKVKNFRDQGGWCGLSAQFIRANGVVPESLWPAKSMSRSYDTAANWQEASKHRILEDFVDLTRSVYEQNLTWQQLVSCLLQNIPCAVDFNWWGHSVCGVDVDELDGEIVLDIDNSWTPEWGTNGTGILRGSRKIPDGAVATRVLNPA